MLPLTISFSSTWHRCLLIRCNSSLRGPNKNFSVELEFIESSTMTDLTLTPIWAETGTPISNLTLVFLSFIILKEVVCIMKEMVNCSDPELLEDRGPGSWEQIPTD